MLSNNIKIFRHIKGIEAASGLYFEQGVLYIISDNAQVLYIYNIENSQLEIVNLKPDFPLEQNIVKKLKPDFESFVKHQNHFYIFGSGSAENRCELLKVSSDFLEIKNISLKDLYHKMMFVASMEATDFNIEGVLLLQHTAYFFNRNNGPNCVSGIFKVAYWEDIKLQQIQFYPLALPMINGVAFGFTDACLVDEVIYFSASAEDTNSTYEDGAVLGSGIGKIDFNTLQLQEFRIVSETLKIEGLTPFVHDENKIKFFTTDRQKF